MQIRCPSCGYTREMPENRLPEGTVVATCPQCHGRFRFSKRGGVTGTAPAAAAPKAPAAKRATRIDGQAPCTPPEAPAPAPRRREGDDPLPPGAIIPGRGMPEEDKAGAPAPDAASRETPGPAKAGDTEREPERDEEAPTAHARADEEAQEADEGEEAGDEGPGEEEEEASFNPWDYAPQPNGWLSAFYQTCLRVMFAASRFFGDLRPQPVLRALVFYLVICVIQILVERVWGMVFLSYFAPAGQADPQLQKVVELLSAQSNLALTLLLRCGFLTLQLYLFAGLLTLCWRFIAPGRAEFSVVFQVLAYAEAPGILCLVPVAGSVVGLVWGLVCVFVGCRAALRLSWGQTILGFVPLALLVLPSLLQLSQLLMQ